MSKREKRVQTLKALAINADARIGGGALNHVVHELQELVAVGSSNPIRRRHLQQVFHSLRALESGLSAVATSHGLPKVHTLGGIFTQMQNVAPGHPCYLDARHFSRFNNYLRKQRNRYMHIANTFPNNEREANGLLGEIDACFSLLIK